MRRLVFVLSACGRIGFDPTTGAPPANDGPDDLIDGAGEKPCADMPSQTFDMLPASYTEYTFGTGTMLEADGTLHITFPAQGGRGRGVETPLVSFRDHTARIRIVKAFSPATDALVQLGLHGRDERGLHFELHEGLLDIRSRDLGGSRVEASEPANPAEVWWRFREAQGTVFCEVSEDAITWRRLFATAPTFFDIDDVFVDIGGDNSSGLPAADDLRFDDFVTACP